MKIKLIDLSRTGRVKKTEQIDGMILVSTFEDKPLIDIEIYRHMLLQPSAPRLTNKVN